MNILGIRRTSQGPVEERNADAAIFDAVASRLFRLGHDVSIISEDMLLGVEPERFDRIFSMAVTPQALWLLAEAERDKGVRIVNSPSAVLKMSRAEVLETLSSVGIVQPPYEFLDITDETPMPSLPLPFVLKTKVKSLEGECDWVMIETEEAFAEAVEDFRSRGYEELVVQQWLEGARVRFYGVAGTEFFRVFPITDDGTLIDLDDEQLLARTFHEHPLSVDALQIISRQASDSTGFEVFGGEALILADGTHLLTKFLDFPSFHPCRKYAAKAIAALVAKE